MGIYLVFVHVVKTGNNDIFILLHQRHIFFGYLYYCFFGFISWAEYLSNIFQKTFALYTAFFRSAVFHHEVDGKQNQLSIVKLILLVSGRPFYHLRVIVCQRDQTVYYLPVLQVLLHADLRGINCRYLVRLSNNLVFSCIKTANRRHMAAG